MQEKESFIADWMAKEYLSFAELCDRYGVSRKTGYKWVGRFKEDGLKGLLERPRGCPSHPLRTSDEMTRQLIALRHKHPAWGPKKLCAWLRARGYSPPAPSTVGAILVREGLVKPRKKRAPRPGDYSSPLASQDRPNAVWAVDFKGWFRLATGAKCYPLTVSDGYSRYLLGCDALDHPDEQSCREAFEKLFDQYGLPSVIRSDNGTPFSGRFGISTLSVWWVKLGIRPERIERGKPSQNGRHERMHRTLKQDAILSAPPGRRMTDQQRVFDRFRHEYNEERPHEALGQRTPGDLYEPSTIRYPRKPLSPSYPSDWSVYRVRTDGTIQLPLRTLMVSVSLRGEPIGLEHHADGSARLFYGPLMLGSFSQSGKFSRGSRHAKASLDDVPGDELAVTPKRQEAASVIECAS